jgi:diguanylate cyclase (GGDEF)-like protein
VRPSSADILNGFVAAVSALGLGLLAFVLRADAGSLLGFDPRTTVFVMAVVAGECVPLRLRRHGTETEITTSSTFAFALLVTAGPAWALLAMSTGVVISDGLRRKALRRILFNVGQSCIGFAAAAAVLATLTSPRGPGLSAFAPEELPAILLAAATYFAINASLVARVITLAEGVSFVPYLKQDFFLQTSTVGLMLGLAPIVVLVSDFSLAALPLLALPLLAIHRSGREAVEKEHQSLHDALTGLPNRLLLRTQVEQAINLSRLDGLLAAVMVLDLDRFKEINDTLGHHHGDLLLCTIAERVTELLGEGDTVARLGGDEFALVLPRVQDEAACVRVAQAVRAAIARPVELQGMRVEVDASIGIACWPDHAEDVEGLMRRADVAMYAAKAAGGGHQIYTAAIDGHSPDRLRLIGELREALESGQLQPVYQPKVDLQSGRAVGVESLLRWRHPERGPIPPDVFIPMAEESGLITALTAHTIRASALQARDWLDLGLALTVAVNLSPRCLLDRALIVEIRRVIEEVDIPPALLHLEITESMVMAEPKRAQDILLQLRAMGLSLSLDDFGTGYSSLSLLKRLPIDELKIDRSFISGMNGDPADAAIVRSTIELAHNLDLRVVAEGVETAEVYELLRDLDCDIAQGFHLSRPLPADEVPRWVTECSQRALEAAVR